MNIKTNVFIARNDSCTFTTSPNTEACTKYSSQSNSQLGTSSWENCTTSDFVVPFTKYKNCTLSDGMTTKFVEVWDDIAIKSESEMLYIAANNSQCSKHCFVGTKMSGEFFNGCFYSGAAFCKPQDNCSVQVDQSLVDGAAQATTLTEACGCSGNPNNALTQDANGQITLNGDTVHCPTTCFFENHLFGLVNTYILNP